MICQFLKTLRTIAHIPFFHIQLNQSIEYI
jgi:hypothetical protein